MTDIKIIRDTNPQLNGRFNRLINTNVLGSIVGEIKLGREIGVGFGCRIVMFKDVIFRKDYRWAMSCLIGFTWQGSEKYDVLNYASMTSGSLVIGCIMQTYGTGRLNVPMRDDTNQRRCSIRPLWNYQP